MSLWTSGAREANYLRTKFPLPRKVAKEYSGVLAQESAIKLVTRRLLRLDQLFYRPVARGSCPHKSMCGRSCPGRSRPGRSCPGRSSACGPFSVWCSHSRSCTRCTTASLLGRSRIQRSPGHGGQAREPALASGTQSVPNPCGKSELDCRDVFTARRTVLAASPPSRGRAQRRAASAPGRPPYPFSHARASTSSGAFRYPCSSTSGTYFVRNAEIDPARSY
jgi:hypothetical protein